MDLENLEEEEELMRTQLGDAELNLGGHCMSGNKKHKVGTTWKEPGKCEIRACHPGGLVSVMECPRFQYDKQNPRPECKVVDVDADLNYPECCEYVYCMEGAYTTIKKLTGDKKKKRKT